MKDDYIEKSESSKKKFSRSIGIHIDELDETMHEIRNNGKEAAYEVDQVLYDEVYEFMTSEETEIQNDINGKGCSYFKNRGETIGEQLEWAKKAGEALAPCEFFTIEQELESAGISMEDAILLRYNSDKDAINHIIDEQAKMSEFMNLIAERVINIEKYLDLYEGYRREGF